MPLSTGDKLGPYEILSLIGKGGMGEVYRARDPRLRRDVAIKVSRDQFTERFSREARTIASLNHTNIAHLYDVGPNYLVMEYVEGEDLKGPLSFDEALPIVQQLIDGIEAAHEKNIIHRDLKPANIKVTPDGVVKILDFGLAKAMEPPRDADPDNSPTLTMGATAAGTILGTAAYMAPEQAKGKEADKRADVWSFAVVLYELLTGKRLFQGESAVEILGGVLNKDPDISAAPQRVHRLLKWCLEKDRKKRLAAISDARGLLDEAPAAPTQSRDRQGASKLWPAATAISAVAALALGLAWYRAPQPELRPLLRFEVDMGPAAQVNPYVASAVLSPDGTQVAYSGRMPDGTNGLYLRRLDEPEGHLVTPFGSTEGPIAFSPDGQWLVFGSGANMRKILAQGGAAVALGQSADDGVTWSDDGHIYIGTTRGLLRDRESGGLGPVAGTGVAVFPHALPGGKAILISESPEAQSADDLDTLDVSVLTVTSGARKRLVQGAYQPTYIAAPDGDGGYLLYVKQRALFAVRFDPETQTVRGAAIPLLEDLAAGLNGGQYSVSRSGTLAYLHGEGFTAYPMMQMDSAGTVTPVLGKQAGYTSPRYSPDGKKIAYVTGNDVWVYDLERRVPTQLTFTTAPKSELAWAPDGKHILVGERNQLLWLRADGGTQPRTLLQMDPGVRVFSTAPDGRVAYGEAYSGVGLRTVPLDLTDPENPKAGKPEPFQDPKAFRVDAAFSPDGKFLAVVEPDTEELFVTPFPGPGGKWKISGAGGKFPVWSKTGHQLYFLAGDDHIMVTDYTVNGDSFQASVPRRWSPTPVLRLAVTANFDISPDGKHAVMFPAAAPTAAPGNLHITFLLNVADELHRRFAAAGK